jgi:iron complex outermembrane receptor protein
MGAARHLPAQPIRGDTRMRIKSHLLATFASLAATGLGVETAAAADQAQGQTQTQAAPAKSAESGTVGEVIVTARRIAEDIQRAPVAVTAVTPIQLQQLHPHDLSDLNHIAPNFTILPSGYLFRNASIGFARGMGYNNIDGTQDPPLGISVDGVFYQRNIGALQDMFDLAGVEILLGPQGTLYGKNTTAGTLNITTQKPVMDEYEESGMLRFGNLGRRDSELVANIPVSDTLAVRVAFQSQYSEGPYTNVAADSTGLGNGIHVGGDNTITVRPSLRWTPSNRFDFTFTYTLLRNRSNSVGGTDESPPGSLADLYLGHPGYGYAGGPTSPYTVDRTFPSGDYFNLDSITADMRYHANGFDIISTSNYMVDTSPVNYDDFTNANLLTNDAIVNHYQYSEELRAQSTGNGPLQWVGGLYYDFSYYDYWQSVQLNFFDPPTFNDGPIDNQWIFQFAHSVAAYAQGDYSVTDKLQLTAGVRVLDETKRAENYTGIILPFRTRDLSDWAPDDIIRAQKTWNAVTYHLGAKYQFTDDLMAYASYSTGFRAGGFSSAAVAPVAPVTPAESVASLGPWAPETTGSFETGVKSEWFEHRLQFNLTGFWTDYNNLQEYQFEGYAGASELLNPVNAGSEVARGIEMQAVAVPVQGLRLDAAVGYLDARFTKYQTSTYDIVPTALGPVAETVALNCTVQHYLLQPGACVPQLSPAWTAHFGASYDINTDYGKFTPTASYSYSSTYFSDNANDPLGRVNSHGTLDTALNFESANGHWGISLWARNITDTRYILGAFNAGYFPGTAMVIAKTQYFADPRTFGVELRVKLDQPKD